jgi:hypothetical protein
MIEPRNSVLASGEQYPFSALGQFSDGHTQDVTQQVSWATSSTMSATVDNGATNTHGTVTAGSVPATVTVSGSIGAISDQTPLTVTLFNHIPASPAQGDTPFKEVDFVAIESLYYSGYPDRDAASQLFTGVFRPYYLAAGNTASQATILNRVKFSCAENLADPTTPGNTLAFPFDLDPARKKAILWHRYNCTFELNYTDTTGTAVSYTSGIYKINQLDIDYNQYPLESGTAFENYNFGSSTEPDYHYLGRYVQPLDKMLRQRDDSVPLEFLAGVNGGYDYRVDAWSSSTSDNICPPRSAPVDRNSFYSHPAPAQCPFGSDALPSCASNDQLPYSDDLGDSLVLLPAAQRSKSWRDEPLQSFNCGGLQESFDRGVVAFYPGEVATLRTSANRGDLAELLYQGKKPLSALGCGPLLIQDRHFVYDEAGSEEGMPLDNYEIAPTVGIGYEHRADGGITVHLVNVDGHDNTAGFHDWMLGLYFSSPYAHSEGANTLGNGGDATFWVHPQGAAVKAVLSDAGNPNHAYFKALFVDNNNPGIASNCDFSTRPIGCGARPVHDGLFVRLPDAAAKAVPAARRG